MHGFFLPLSLVGLAIFPLRAIACEEFVSEVRSAAKNNSKPTATNSHCLIKRRRSIELNDGTVRSVAVSPDGKTVMAGGNRFVQLFDLKTGKTLRRFEGHRKEVLSVAFSPDGKLLASVGKQAMANETTIRLWDVHTEGPARVIRIKDRFQRDRITRVAFLPDAKTLVTCSPNSRGQNQVQLVDVEKGLWTYRARVVNPREPLDMAVSPDGKFIVVGDKLGVVALWEVAEFGIRARFPEDRNRHRHARYFRMHHDGDKPLSSVAFSPDGQRLVSSGWDNTTRVWDVKTGRLLLKIAGPNDAEGFAGTVFSRDGDSIFSVTKDERIQMWDAANGKLLATVKGSDQSVQGLRISPDGNVLATFGSRGVVELWEIAAKPHNKK